MQILELPNHPFFMGTQAHPELTSRPLRPQPMFVGFLAAAIRGAYQGESLKDPIAAVEQVSRF
jgi:CTP synthase